MQQDYLYMFQACIALEALLAVVLVSGYQVIDNYVDNRKEALRTIVDVKNHPERAAWVQKIGKRDVKGTDFDQELLDLNIATVATFVEEIGRFRKTRDKLVDGGKRVIAWWGGFALIYLFAQTFNLYQSITYRLLMISFVLPVLVTYVSFRWAVRPKQ